MSASATQVMEIYGDSSGCLTNENNNLKWRLPFATDAKQDMGCKFRGDIVGLGGWSVKEGCMN